MQEEIKRTEEEVVDNTDYIAAIKELKENSVDRSKYDALKADNKRLLDSIVNGQTIETETKKEPVNIDELRKKVFNNDAQTDLSYITNVLELRDALIENGEGDPFLPVGQKIAPTEEDIAAANRVAEGLKAMVETADGNNDIFLNEYQRRVMDTTPRRR